MTVQAIDLVVLEYGRPGWELSDDGESSFWTFSDDKTMAADSLGDLLAMACARIDAMPNPSARCAATLAAGPEGK